MLSRVVGFLREWYIAWAFGATSVTDAYNAGFTIPDWVNYLAAGGTASITFVSIYTRFLAEKREQEAQKTFSVIVTVMTAVLGIGILAAEIFAPQLIRLMFGKFQPDTRISQRIIHVGVVVSDRAAADRFYKDILGFKEIWHGGMKDTETDWVDMRVPDGTDWLEYMLNVHNPDPHELGVMHHFALGVPSVKAGYETALKRGYKPDEKPQIGRDGKWQFNMYDPNFTRVELMEPKPVEKPCCSAMLQ